LAYVLWFLRLRLMEDPCGLGDQLAGSLGTPNAITLTRAGIYAGLAGGLFMPLLEGVAAWLPGLIYAVAAGTDGLDGYLARRRGQTTRLGKQLDVEVDGLGVLVATALAVHYGQLPTWYLSTGLAYYAFRAILYLRRRSGGTVMPLPPSTMRRIVGGFQVGFLAVVLLPLFAPPTTTVAGIVFAVMFFGSFLRDGLVASGLMSVEGASYHHIQTLWSHHVRRWMPVVLRATLAVGAVLLIMRASNGVDSAWSDLVTHGPGGLVLFIAWLFVIIVTSVLTVVGAAGRLAALGVLTAVSADALLTGLAPLTTLLLVSALLLMFLGSGAGSLCQPEERYLTPGVTRE
jgi:CDP-diacylglycerol--glycerol-3-phosphate 3-phosphatidyltransferase